MTSHTAPVTSEETRAGRDAQAVEPAHAWAATYGRPDRLLVALCVIFVFALCVVVQHATIWSYDGKVMYAVARAMVHGRLSITRAEDLLGLNTPYSFYGIGMSLFVLPFYGVQRALGIQRDWMVLLANPAIIAATGATLYRIARTLGWSRLLAVSAPIVFVTTTMVLQHSTDVLSEPGIGLSLCLVILGVLRWRVGSQLGALYVGLGYAFSILLRVDSVLLVGVAVLLAIWIVPWPFLWRPRPLALVAVPVLASVVWTCVYSEIRDGSLFPQTYGGGFSTPFAHGLWGLVVSGGRGFFYYNAFLLLALPGAVLLARRDVQAACLLFLPALARPLFYARWSDWDGGTTYGPRFLVPCAAPLALLAVYGVATAWRSGWLARIGGVLVTAALAAVSVAVNIGSVWVPYTGATNAVSSVPRGVPPNEAAEIVARQRQLYVSSFWHGAAGYNLRHMVTPYWALAHFRSGASAVSVFVGLAALVVAGLALVAVVILAAGPLRERN